MIHPIPTDVLFHVERTYEEGRIDAFRMGDLVRYNGDPAVIVGVPDTVMGHYAETPLGGLICLDIATWRLGKFSTFCVLRARSELKDHIKEW
jgi:hypothetical protein